MNTHKFNLSPAQQKKLLKGVSVQLKPSDLQGELELNVSKPMKTRLNRGVRLGKGLRIKLNKEEIGYNVHSNPNLRQHAPKKFLTELDGGKINIGNAFKKAGRFLNKNRKNILKGVVSVAAPIALKALSQYTGIPFDAATKNIIDVSNKGIDKSVALKIKKPPKSVPAPVAPIAVPVAEPVDDDGYDGEDDDMEGGKLKRRRGRPRKGGLLIHTTNNINASNNKLIGKKTQMKAGALFPAGGALYPSGYHGGAIPITQVAKF